MKDYIIHLQDIINENACLKAVKTFKRFFGTQATCKEAFDLIRVSKRPDWLVWCMGHKVEWAKVLLKEGESINRKDKDGNIALHWAAYEGKADVVQFLIDKGARINARDYSRKTPLHDAAYTGHTQIVKILLANGAWVNARGTYGETPLFIAESSDKSNKEIIELLREHGAKTE